jgi:DNA-binding HxlR family transcriptional regulator
MSDNGYSQFCPVSMAAEIVCSRWTMLLLREMVMGSTRFNELRRGLPAMSPALLSKRLKELEAAGVISRHPAPRDPGIMEYRLTQAGQELRPIVEGLGVWGQRWVTTDATLDNLDASLLMWAIRRGINVDPLPPRRATIMFIFEGQPPAEMNYWLVVEPETGVDLCMIDPGFDVDLYVATTLRTMTEIWLGYMSLRSASRNDKLMLTGNPEIAGQIEAWLRMSTFAGVEKIVA